MAETSQAPLEGADFQSDDILPALNLTFELSPEMNLRGGVSRTLARAELRELAPFGFADYAGGANVVGNPNLRLTTVDNLDARWEWFFRPGGIISVSPFYKKFTDPIEVAILPSTELLKTWVNAPEANNIGLEFEFRSGLEILAESLENVSLSTNLTLVDSEVKPGDRVLVYLPGAGSTELRLREERSCSPGSIGLRDQRGLTWETRWGGTGSALFNRFGRRIDAVGGLGSPRVRGGPKPAGSRRRAAHRGPDRFEVLGHASPRQRRDIQTIREGAPGIRLGRNVSLSLSWET